MIDLDQLDEQLELALTEEVRLLRGTSTGRPAPAWASSPATAFEQPIPAPPPPAPRPAPTVLAPAAHQPRPASRGPARPVKGPLRPAAPLSGTALERLRQAAAATSGPAPAPRDLVIADHARLIPDLVAQGDLAKADHHIAAHATLTKERGLAEDRADAAAWDTMRALLDGRREDAANGVDTVRRLGQEARDADASERAWTQRFWVGLEWGDDREQSDLLDHCRERAYRYDDLPWRGALTLQLARLGRLDEAAREFDAVAAHVKRLPTDATTLDILTNLAEVAFLLRDYRRGAPLEQPLAGATVALVDVGPAWVCKGSLARYHAHVAAAKGSWTTADQYFAAAAKTHRGLGAEPLLARTLDEWGASLLGRDDALASRHLEESAALAGRLGLTGVGRAARLQPS